MLREGWSIESAWLSAFLILVQYGNVERVFISRDSQPPVPVFVKFTNQLSALRVSFISTDIKTKLS